MNKFYVYAHSKTDHGDVFYIGKGCGRRARNQNGRSILWNRVVSKHGLTVTILHDQLSEADAFRLECAEIEARRPLCNFTDGGEGISGYTHTNETKEALRRAHAGRKQDPEVVARRAISLRGKKRTPEQCASLVNNMLGKKHTDETRAKMRASHADRPPPRPDVVERVAEFHRGRKRSAESRARMSAAQPKKPVRCIDNGIVFDSVSSAAGWIRQSGRETASKQGIWFAAQGRLKTAYGYRWEYCDGSHP